jgi:hypothetical protein
MIGRNVTEGGFAVFPGCVTISSANSWLDFHEYSVSEDRDTQSGI